MQYNWQQSDWPNFRFSLSGLEKKLLQIVERQGQIVGRLEALPKETQEQSIVDIIVAEAVKNSAIEGEYLSREDVLSSVRNNLGLNRFPEKVKDKRAEGVVRLTIAVRETYAEPLTEEKLFEWHQMVMEPYANINTGQWRLSPEPMQIISGSAGREVIHFEAPPSGSVPKEMRAFIHWYNRTAPNQPKSILHAPVRSVISKVRFFEKFSKRLNPRQEKVLSRMFEAGPDGFEGGMSAKKYQSITKTSKATATRDLQALASMGALKMTGSGRSTRYHLNWS